MKHTVKRILFITLAFTMLTVPAVVSARGGDDTVEATEHTGSTSSPSPTVKPEESTSPEVERTKQQHLVAVETKKADLRVKLDDAKKKVCEKHQGDINKVISNMNSRRQNAFTHITNVVTAVEKFYVTKQLTVANYSSLVATVDSAKSAAQTAMDAQQATPQLDCSGDHPRADVADFKEKRASSIGAMKTYRSAAKDLIKAVKAAADAVKDGSDA